MKSVCLFFQVHQPFRYRRYRFFDIGNDHYYYDDYANQVILERVAENCYLPANKLLLELFEKHQGDFKVTFAISGTAIDQFELYAPGVIESFKKLADTGCAEFVAMPYPHSLVALADKKLLEKQVERHSKKIADLFGQKPKVFFNTEMIYSDEIGAQVADMGFEAVLTEGAKHILGWKSPDFLYVNALNPRLKVLMRNFKLSDDITFRFSNTNWSEYPLTAEKFSEWLLKTDKNDEIINLFMNYETIGEVQKKESGIFEFLKMLPAAVLATGKLDFATPSEIACNNQPISAVHVPQPVSWAGEERDMTIWFGNEMQEEAFSKLYSLKKRMKKCSDAGLNKDWDYLQVSDHFYYMSAIFFGDGGAGRFFNPFGTPYEAFINYMNILSDFKIRLNTFVPEKKVQNKIASLNRIIEEKEAKIKKYEAEINRLLKHKKAATHEGGNQP